MQDEAMGDSTREEIKHLENLQWKILDTAIRFYSILAVAYGAVWTLILTLAHLGATAQRGVRLDYKPETWLDWIVIIGIVAGILFFMSSILPVRRALRLTSKRIYRTNGEYFVEDDFVAYGVSIWTVPFVIGSIILSLLIWLFCTPMRKGNDLGSLGLLILPLVVVLMLCFMLFIVLRRRKLYSPQCSDFSSNLC